MPKPADFSARSTDVGETSNFMSPQQGIKDESLAAIIGGAGNAAMMGVETYATVKGKQFAKGYEAMTNVGLGAEPASEEEKQFQDRLDRIQQTAKIGRVDTAKILREEFLRKSIADRPWMGKRYQEMAGQVDSRYTDLVAVLQKAEALQATSISDQAKAAAKVRAAQIKRLERTSEPLGHVPLGRDRKFKPWEAMDRSELEANEFEIQNTLHRKRILEAGRGDVEYGEAREKMGFARNSEGRRQNAEGRANYGFGQTVQEDRGKALAESELAHTSAILSSQMNQWVIDNPGASKEELLKAASELIPTASTSLRNQLVQLGGSPGISISPTAIDASTATLEGNLQAYVDSVTGPAGDSAVVARQYQAMQDQIGITSFKLLPFQNILNKAGIKFDVQSMTQLQAILGQDQGVEAANKSLQDLSNAFGVLLTNPESFYTPTGSKVDMAVQAVSTNILVDSYKQGSPSYKALLANPASSIPLIAPAADAWKAEPNPDNKDIIFNAITNPLMLDSLDKANPASALKAYDAISKIAKIRLASVVNPNDFTEYVQAFDPATRTFVPIPENRISEKFTNMANTTYRVAEAIEKKMNGDADPDRLIRTYFSPQLADKLITVEAQPQ